MDDWILYWSVKKSKVHNGSTLRKKIIPLSFAQADVGGMHK